MFLNYFSEHSYVCTLGTLVAGLILLRIDLLQLDGLRWTKSKDELHNNRILNWSRFELCIQFLYFHHLFFSFGRSNLDMV